MLLSELNSAQAPPSKKRRVRVLPEIDREENQSDDEVRLLVLWHRRSYPARLRAGFGEQAREARWKRARSALELLFRARSALEKHTLSSSVLRIL